MTETKLKICKKCGTPFTTVRCRVCKQRHNDARTITEPRTKAPPKTLEEKLATNFPALAPALTPPKPFEPLPAPSLPVEITVDEVYNLAILGMPLQAMCEYFGCAKSELIEYTALIAKGRADTSKALRAAQLQSALTGNAALAVWLGKVTLGQVEAPVKIEATIKSLTEEEINAKLLTYVAQMRLTDERDITPTDDPEKGAN